MHAYPEINLQTPRTAKLAVAHLERHGHLVVPVQVLVEAFVRVGAQLDVVGEGCEWEEPEQAGEEGCDFECHCFAVLFFSGERCGSGREPCLMGYGIFWR